jgi:anti-anti-sigma factor
VPDLCSIDFESRGNVLVARISGEIDISNVDAVAARLAAMFERADHYVVDLSGTTHLDSAGIHLLFTLGERLRTRRQTLHLVVPSDAPIRRVLRLADIGAVVSLSDDVDDVVARAAAERADPAP